MFVVVIVQPYLSKLFGNIKRLEFSDDRVSPPILAMVSAEDERIKISRYGRHVVERHALCRCKVHCRLDPSINGRNQEMGLKQIM